MGAFMNCAFFSKRVLALGVMCRTREKGLPKTGSCKGGPLLSNKRGIFGGS